MRQGRFEGVVNKTLTDDRGNQYIQVKHQNRFFKVNIAQTEDEFREVLGFDNRFFRGKQAITLQVLQLISQFGKVVFYRAPENGEIQGVSQILYQSIPQQEVRMGEAFLYGTAGIGHGQVLFKAQEVLAREANKALIRGTVRVENTQTIRALFKAGYRIMAFDPSRYAALEEGGGRLVMEKDLIHEQFPFDPLRQTREFRKKNVPVVENLDELEPVISQKSPHLGIFVRNRDVLQVDRYHLIHRTIMAGYFGVGLLHGEEITGSNREADEKLLFFHHSDVALRADRLTLQPSVKNEYGRLREVIVSYTPENAQIRAEYAINDVARQNVNNIDPIAFKDEYNLFVGTLVAQDVRVVHTNAIGKDGKSAIFTRDPAYVLGETFVIGALAQPQRRYESDGMRQISEAVQQMDLSGDTAAVTEGGDIIFLDKNRIVVGLGQRSNQAGLDKLRHLFPGYTFIGVPHNDLHLDVLFTMLAPKKCLADLSQLPAEFVALLREEGFHIIEGDPTEQVSLGCNVVCIEPNRVVAAKENAVTNQRLKDAGVEVIEVSMPNVVKWGGGPRCMTCPVFRD